MSASNSAGGRAGVVEVDPDGVARLTQERDKLTAKVRRLKQRNEELAEKIDDLEFRNEKLVEELDELRVDPGEFWGAVSSIHWDTPNPSGPGLICAHDGHRWPCPTIDALERIN